MKVKLLKRVRKQLLIKHTVKGTAIMFKDFTDACLISGTSTWRSALLIRYLISFSYSEEHLRRVMIRNNKRIYNSDEYSINASPPQLQQPL